MHLREVCHRLMKFRFSKGRNRSRFIWLAAIVFFIVYVNVRVLSNVDRWARSGLQLFPYSDMQMKQNVHVIQGTVS